MSLPRFLVGRGVAEGERVDLETEEAKHACVRRLRPGEPVVLFDGAGSSWLGVVDACTRRAVAVMVTKRFPEREGESPLDLTLALAVLKADRIDWVVEKATELGVRRIRPFISQHSLARPSAARQARWRQIALSAAKQCGRTVVPRVEIPVDWDALLSEPSPRRLLFWETRDARSVCEIAAVLPPPERLTVVIGPEGGFATAEIDAARRAGCDVVGLGQRILRAETAAVAAVALCQHLWGDLGKSVAQLR